MGKNNKMKILRFRSFTGMSLPKFMRCITTVQ